jgi:predicted Zn-dependent protease
MQKLLFFTLFLWLQSAFAVTQTAPSATLIPDKTVSAAGIKSYNEHLKSITLSDNSDLISKLNCVGKQLTNNSINIPDGTEWEFVVANDISPNVYSFAGGKIIVNLGLIEILKDNDMLAAALANPISAILLKQANKRLSFMLVATQFKNQTTEEAMSALKKYDQAFTLEADNTSYDLLLKSNIDPNAMLRATSLIQSLNIEGDPVFKEARIKNIERLLAKKGTSSIDSSSPALTCP